MRAFRRSGAPTGFELVIEFGVRVGFGRMQIGYSASDTLTPQLCHRTAPEFTMTFSLVARCKSTGMLGVAISSSSPAVAARCAFAKAGVAAVASQNVTDPSLGPRAIALIEGGITAKEALGEISASTAHINYRQLLAVDADGNSAIFSGEQALGVVSEFKTDNAAAAGNLLDNTSIPEAMITTFKSESGHLGDRLIKSLQAAVAAGGEAGPVHSAGMLIVDKVSWPVAELRCDWSPQDCPIQNITTAWETYKPQLEDYVQRAVNPSQAPSYGVPGDE